MRTSRASWLTPPQGDAKISEGTFGYLTARVRQRAYDIVVREFKRSGLSKAQLARRWGKDPALVTRLFARPGNWEIDTYTEALFAISGAVPQFSLAYVQDRQSSDISIIAPSPKRVAPQDEIRPDLESLGLPKKEPEKAEFGIKGGLEEQLKRAA